MQGDHACHYGGQGRGNLWVAGVGEMLRAIHQIAVNYGVEGVAHLACCPGKLDSGASRSDLDGVKSSGGQPVCGGLKVGVSRSKLRAELLGSQPDVMLWRIESELIVQQLAQGRFLFRRALQ